MVTLTIQVNENLLDYLTHEAEKMDKPIEEVAVTLLEKQAFLSEVNPESSTNASGNTNTMLMLAQLAQEFEGASEIDDHEEDLQRPNGLLMIALAAEALGIDSEEDDLAERSREILNTAYFKHLSRYQDER